MKTFPFHHHPPPSSSPSVPPAFFSLILHVAIALVVSCWVDNGLRLCAICDTILSRTPSPVTIYYFPFVCRALDGHYRPPFFSLSRSLTVPHSPKTPHYPTSSACFKQAERPSPVFRDWPLRRTTDTICLSAFQRSGSPLTIVWCFCRLRFSPCPSVASLFAKLFAAYRNESVPVLSVFSHIWFECVGLSWLSRSVRVRCLVCLCFCVCCCRHHRRCTQEE